MPDVTTDVRIRALDELDLDGIVRIDEKLSGAYRPDIWEQRVMFYTRRDPGASQVAEADGKVVGSTRFLDIRRSHRSLEIGSTWLSREAQRTVINTEAKLLQLTHAFEQHGAVRVQLKTDRRNEASRRAIARLGAVEEGLLRNYQTRYDGYVRDTVMFSLTAAEWPEARIRLEARLMCQGFAVPGE